MTRWILGLAGLLGAAPALAAMVIVYNLDGSGRVMRDPTIPSATQTQTIPVSAVAGQKTLLGTFNLITPECRTADGFQALIKAPPKGSLVGESTEMVAAFPAGDPRQRCNGSRYKALALSYVAKTPGDDSLAMLIPGLNRAVIEVTFRITVR